MKEKMREYLSDLPSIIFLGNPKYQLVNFCPISLPGLDAERLIFALEEREVYLSTGAACAASKGKKSATLQAIGLSDVEIAGSLRITMGKLNKEEDIETFSNIIHEVVQREWQRIK